MWIIVGSIFIAITFQSLYSLVLYFWSNYEYCYIYKGFIRSAWTIFARSLQYVLWYYPIFWLFWPPGLSLFKQSPKERLSTRQVTVQEDNSYYDEYGSETDNKSANSFNVNMNTNPATSAMYIGPTSGD